MMSDEHYMGIALQEAEEAFRRGEVPVGAIVVTGGTIIARAHNLTIKLNDPTAHAEMQAITAAAAWLGGEYLQECTLYVTMEPCVMCAGALYWSRPERIVYGCSDPKRGYSLYTPSLIHPKTVVTGQILEDECSGIVKKFFRERRHRA